MIKYEGPEFLASYFYLCPQDLKLKLPKHNVCQGIQCLCGHKQLKILKRRGNPTVFCYCEHCKEEFKIYENSDYSAGFISDDPTKPLDPIACEYCGEQIFYIAVGYEYPGDETASIDITWFTMVGKCAKCGRLQQLFNDETA